MQIISVAGGRKALNAEVCTCAVKSNPAVMNIIKLERQTHCGSDLAVGYKGGQLGSRS